MQNPVTNSQNPRFQSPSLFIQAAGSDGSDGSKTGIHLRWDLLGNLGNSHIPKGAAGPSGNDYVEIYRAEYAQEYACIIDFNALPSLVYEQGDKRYWRYNGFVPVSSVPGNLTHIVVRFTDVEHYDMVRSSINPANNPFEFINHYDQLIEIQAAGKLMLHFAFQENQPRNPLVEAVSLPPDQAPNGAFVSNRNVLANTPGSDFLGLTEEHIEYVRFVRAEAIVSMVRIVTYQDTLLGYDSEFEWVDAFALTTDTNIALARLHSGGGIHASWRKYNGGATVNLSNYEERWNPPNPNVFGEGIKTGVEKYLQLSLSDPVAIEGFTDDEAGNPTAQELSYLQMLKFASFDYHVARMLGLGHIDTAAAQPDKKYIYLARYVTLTDPETGEGALTTHLSLSLPASQQDYRLPPVPKIDEPIKYGLFWDGGTATLNSNLADEDGYDFYNPVRYISLFRKEFRFERGLPLFFEEPDAFFSLARESLVVQFGLEYTDASGAMLSPELLHDAYFKDASGIEEPLCIPFDGNFVVPVFTHHEKEAGIHTYGLYCVNWFSRVSPTSPMVSTDETAFPDRCSLLPPANLAVQLIQPEDPIILTTTAEQEMLGGLYDKALLRLTFEWNQKQMAQYFPDTADAIEFFFRELPPVILKGQILDATDLGNGKASVTLSDPPPGGSPEKFRGSLLVADRIGYYVEDLDGPILIVRQVKSTTPIDTENNNYFIITEQFTLPSGNYVLAENLADPHNWDQQLSLGISIPGAILNVSNPVEVAEIPGLYEFPIPSLPSPPSGVYWFKGAVFMGNGVTLQVWKLDEAENKILAFDPESANEGYPGLSSSEGRYYPGFGLYAEENSGLTKEKVLPQGSETQKMTYLAARARDSANGCTSPITTPVVILAQKIEAPEQPQMLAGPVFVTRPGFYGKATYTFDVQVNTQDREPYALAFYRADAQKVLGLLYQPSTVESILNDPGFLPGLDNPAFTTLWSDFVNGNGLGDFPAPDNDAYIIPVPDPSLKNHPFDGSIPYSGSMEVGLYHNPDGSLVSETRAMQQIIQDAIVEAFVPLTQQPLVYSHIDEATAGELTTSSAPPVLMNDQGEPLSSDDPDFKPYPMALRFGGNKVRFTDYTIDGSSLSFYFYFAIELSNRLIMSERSAIAGPIQLVNTFPPEAVAIKKVTVRPANRLFNIPVGVVFEVNPYISAENIRKFQIFRGSTPQEALSVRTMTLAATIDAGEPLADDFSDLGFPPYGEPVYYRIVALREIINENNEQEFVPSEPSNTALASIIDVNNPDAPQLSYTGTPSGSQILDVHLIWDKTVHNGIYYLHKMNQYGNWVKIHQLESNAVTLDVNLADTSLGSNTLEKEYANGDPVYHHFKIVAENASGLLSLDERVLTI